MERDISKRTVAVLVLLSVVLSVIGAWNILTSESMFTGSTIDQTQQNAMVAFGVTPPPQNEAQGKVTFGIKKMA